MRSTISRSTCAAVAAAVLVAPLSGCYSAGGWSMPKLANLNPVNWGKKNSGSSLASKGGENYPAPPSINMSPTNPNSSLAGGSNYGRSPTSPGAGYSGAVAGAPVYSAQQTGGYDTGPYATGGAASQSPAAGNYGTQNGFYTADQRGGAGYSAPNSGYGGQGYGAQPGYGGAEQNAPGGYGAPSYGNSGAAGNGAYQSGASQGGYGAGQTGYGAGAGTSGAGTNGYGAGSGASGYGAPDSGYGAGSQYGSGGSTYGSGSPYGTGNTYGSGGSTYGSGGSESGPGTYGSGGGDSGAYGGSGGYSPGSVEAPGFGSVEPKGESKSAESKPAESSSSVASLSVPSGLLQRSGDYAPGSIRRTQLASATADRATSYTRTETGASPAQMPASGGSFGGNGPLPGFGLPSYQ